MTESEIENLYLTLINDSTFYKCFRKLQKAYKDESYNNILKATIDLVIASCTDLVPNDVTIATEYEDARKVTERILSYYEIERENTTLEELLNDEKLIRWIPTIKGNILEEVINNIETVYGTTKREAQELACIILTKLNIKETTMSTDKIIVRTVHYINDISVTDLTQDQLIDSIKRVEEEIKSLEAIESKSTAVTQAIKDRKDTLKFIIQQADKGQV